MAAKRKYGLNSFISLNTSLKFYTGVCNLIHMSDEKKGSTATEETPTEEEDVKDVAEEPEGDPSDEEADEAPEPRHQEKSSEEDNKAPE